jgi:hypothetical protein
MYMMELVDGSINWDSTSSPDYPGAHSNPPATPTTNNNTIKKRVILPPRQLLVIDIRGCVHLPGMDPNDLRRQNKRHAEGRCRRDLV